MKMQFDEFKCDAVLTHYINDNTAIQLYDVEDGCPVATATVNLYRLPEKELAFIKDYGENTGMLNALIKYGIVEKVLCYERSGYEQVPLCKINLEAFKDD